MAIGDVTYLQLVSSYKGNDIVADLIDSLVPLWRNDYAASCPASEVLEVSDGTPSGPSFSYLFDLNLQRNVVAWGIPGYVAVKRDKRRMADHPLGGDHRYHRGHLMSHGTGGGTDINLIPQRGSLNIGAFRRLERLVRSLAQQHQTCLYFVRTLYTDESQMPHQIEQCVIQPSRAVSYAMHSNV